MRTIQQQLEQALKGKLNEGNIWDRNEDGSMPTLADTTARYAKSMREGAMSTVEAEEMAVEILNNLMDNDIIERGFDEDLATELIVSTLDGTIVSTFEGTTARHAESMKEASTNDLDVMRGIIGKVDEDVLNAIEDGYYAIADNLPNLINDIQKAIKIHAKALPADMEEIKVLRNELKIYNEIQTLIDESTFGQLL